MMKPVCIALSLCTALALGGCANKPEFNMGDLLPGAMQADAGSRVNDGDRLYLAVIEGLIKQGRTGAALAFLDSYKESGQPVSPHYWLLRGNALLGLGRIYEASAAFAELDGSPLAAAGWNGMGRTAASMHDWLTAETDFKKAVAGDPANADFLNNLAFADLHLGKTGGSVAWLQQAHELAPGSDRIRNNLIIALTLKGDSDGAEAAIAAIKDSDDRAAARQLVARAVKKFQMDEKS